MSSRPIHLLLADVDGTLVTNDKALTDRSVDAVRRLRDAGIYFAVTSGRPPRGIIALIESSGLDVWVHRGAEWYVRDRAAPHVAREAFTVRFEPTVLESYKDLSQDVAKIVGVSDDHDLVASASTAAHNEFGDHVSAARSQPYYLDVTHPQANKGGVVRYLSERS